MSTLLAVEDVDQQIERAFEAIRAQMAAGTLTAADGPVTAAKIRRAHGIGDAAAAQVLRFLAGSGLLAPWNSKPADNAAAVAAELGQEEHAPLLPMPAAPADGPVPPWLARGEPVRIGGFGDDTVARAWPTRRHPHPVDALAPERNWQAVRDAVPGPHELDAAGTDPALLGVLEAMWRSLASPTPAGSPQTDAILLAFCLDEILNTNVDVAGPVIIDYLVMRHGLPGCVAILLDAMRYGTETDYAGPHAGLVRVHLRASRPPARDRSGALDAALVRLRAHLAAAPQDVHDACAAQAAEGIGKLDPNRQIALALLFPDRPHIAHDVIFRLCADDGTVRRDVHWLQLNATDPAALALARKVEIELYRNFWQRTDMVATILLEHRLDAVRWLAPGAADDAAGDALARIGTPESLDALARAASSSKRALARFALAAERWPAAAACALARILAGQTKDRSLLMPTLVDLVRRHPALPAELQPWIEPGADAVLEDVRARLAGPADVAGPEDLPEVLVRVPWQQPKKKAVASLKLASLPLASVECWAEGEREEILKLNPSYAERYRDAVRSPATLAERLCYNGDDPSAGAQAARNAMRAALAQGDAAALFAAWRDMLADERARNPDYFYYALDGHLVAHMPPELGIPFWNAAAAESPCAAMEFVAATWGLAAFPGMLARIARAPADNFGFVSLFGAVELAPVVARAFARLKSLREPAREWLARFPEYAACGLIAPALGKPGEARDCAAAGLRYLASIGHGALLDEVAGRYGQPDVVAALHAMLSENPLDRYPNKRPALPEFWQPGGWHCPRLHNGKALSDAALDTLGTMMAFPVLEDVYAGLYQVKDACTPQSLADFAWDCFSAWLNAAAPAKESWAMLRLGVFGNDDTARRLTPLIRAWPSEGAQPRAVAALDVLAGIGSDVALMLLNGIAQKVKSRSLQDKARDKIAAVAEARGFTSEELEDRVAPDLGLDDAGSLVLDFGPRAFMVGFDEALKPYVREWHDGRAGARLPDLPKPKKTDDAALAAAAAERFRLLKKDARTIAAQQVRRLELAMCMRRRWAPGVFAQFLAGHPLVRHLVRRLVWGVYALPDGTDGDGHGGVLQACFRVAEDGQYTTADDDPFTLPEGDQYRIGLPHALEIPADAAAAFGQLLADYELLQPFPQLGRDTYALTDGERASDELLRWQGIKVPTGKVLGLAHVGWRRGPTQDGGSIRTFDKRVDAARTLELNFEPGIIAALVDEHPEQTLGGITFGRRPSTFDTLDTILASELIRDMERLRS